MCGSHSAVHDEIGVFLVRNQWFIRKKKQEKKRDFGMQSYKKKKGLLN